MDFFYLPCAGHKLGSQKVKGSLALPELQSPTEENFKPSLHIPINADNMSEVVDSVTIQIGGHMTSHLCKAISIYTQR